MAPCGFLCDSEQCMSKSDECIMRSGVKCQVRLLLAFQWFKSSKSRDGRNLWNKGPVNFDTALTDFNARQFKTWMNKMAAQVDFFCFLMFFFCLACNMVPENWHICVNKGLTYLLTQWNEGHQSPQNECRYSAVPIFGLHAKLILTCCFITWFI